MSLAPHFTMIEVVRSQTAAKQGIDNQLPSALRYNIGRTAQFMECVRALLGDDPIKVTSWYRCQMLNSAVGGTKTSMHPKGLAVDFKHSVLFLEEVYSRIAASTLPYDQLIIEGTRSNAEWIHLGLSEGEPRRDTMTADRDRIGGPMAYIRTAEG